VLSVGTYSVIIKDEVSDLVGPARYLPAVAELLPLKWPGRVGKTAGPLMIPGVLDRQLIGRNHGMRTPLKKPRLCSIDTYEG